MKNSIIVSGLHRSGTTWVGEVLALSPDVTYHGEPFTPKNCSWYLADSFITEWYYYFKDRDKEQKLPVIKHGLGLTFSFKDLIRHFKNSPKIRTKGGWLKRFLTFHLGNKKELIKDPLLLFNLPWIEGLNSTKTVLVIRHPAAFYSSIKRMNKYNGWEIDIENWLLSQEELLNQSFIGKKELIQEYSEKSEIEKATFFWCLTTEFILEQGEKFPSWEILLHEDLAENPLVEFEKLYSKLGMNYSDEVRRKITKMTSSKNPTEAKGSEVHIRNRNSKDLINRWEKDLSQKEISYISNKTDYLTQRLYN